MKTSERKRAILIGATSGIGLAVARILVEKGWRIGVAGRRKEQLRAFQATAPEQIEIECIDVTLPEATERLQMLIEKVGGMDLYFHSTGIGSQNPQLDPEIELATVQTNADGFVRMTNAAYAYFRQQASQQKGHIAVISSVAGTKGIGIAPSYSATKRFQNTYLDALAQLARTQQLPICFTDIRPGFVATDLLKNRHYPMLMEAEYVAQEIIKGLEKKKRVVTIDWRYRLLVFFWRMIPRPIWERIKLG